MSKQVKAKKKRLTFGQFLANNSVPIMFILFCAVCIPISGFSPSYLLNEIVTRMGRNTFLILCLLIPIMAGMGLNFGMTLGAMAGEIALIFVSDWQIWGIPGVVLAMILSIPISILLGAFCGSMLNRARGREMITSYIISFFINGVYQLVVLYMMGSIIPIQHSEIKLPRGYGIRNTVSLLNMRQCIDNLLAINVNGVKIPVLTFILIALLCLFIIWFRKTKLGQDMRAVGQDMEVARDAGIKVERTRILSIVMSTVFAGFGMILYLQNMGNLSTYSSHSQIGMFCIAALLVGGASVDRASIGNVFLGVTLFHLMFIVAPAAGAKITGQMSTFHYDMIDQIEGAVKMPAMETFPTMIVAVSSGAIDGYVADRPGAVSATSANADLTYITFDEGQGFTVSPDDAQIAVGVKQGSPLKAQINEILAGISAEERNAIMDAVVLDQPLSE